MRPRQQDITPPSLHALRCPGPNRDSYGALAEKGVFPLRYQQAPIIYTYLRGGMRTVKRSGVGCRLILESLYRIYHGNIRLPQQLLYRAVLPTHSGGTREEHLVCARCAWRRQLSLDAEDAIQGVGDSKATINEYIFSVFGRRGYSVGLIALP